MTDTPRGYGLPVPDPVAVARWLGVARPCDCPPSARPDYFCPVHEAHLLPAPTSVPSPP